MLMKAAECCHEEGVRLLVEAGADLNCSDKVRSKVMTRMVTMKKDDMAGRKHSIAQSSREW